MSNYPYTIDGNLQWK